MRILRDDDVQALLEGRQLAVMHVVQSAYVRHAEGLTEIPDAAKVRLESPEKAFAVASPVRLGGRQAAVGASWVMSFPQGSTADARETYSVTVLSDPNTGQLLALLGADQISDWCTAASAALASHFLHGDREVRVVGLIGCGSVNGRVMDFLTPVHPEIRTVLLHDAAPDRLRALVARVRAQYPGADVRVADVGQMLEQARTISVDTAAESSWLDLCRFPNRHPDQVILHLSARDLHPSCVACCYNVVDDMERVFREDTSLRRTGEELGHRGFVHAILGELLGGRTRLARPEGATAVFTPVGLPVLDLAVAVEILNIAEEMDRGHVVEGISQGRGSPV